MRPAGGAYESGGSLSRRLAQSLFEVLNQGAGAFTFEDQHWADRRTAIGVRLEPVTGLIPLQYGNIKVIARHLCGNLTGFRHVQWLF